MALAWTEDLATGIALIDEEHKECFVKADQLFEAGKKGKGKEEVGKMLLFLDEYTRKHFKDEEDYMLRLGYPGYAEQKQMHDQFIEQLKKLRQEYDQSGGNLLVILNANQMVIDWLIQHISVADKRIGKFVREQQK